jgi:hypothetical protein
VKVSRNAPVSSWGFGNKFLGWIGFEKSGIILDSEIGFLGWTAVGIFENFGIFWLRNSKSSEIGPEGWKLAGRSVWSVGLAGLGLVEAGNWGRTGLGLERIGLGKDKVRLVGRMG